MELPAELRLRIAEYTLSADDPLEWHWINFDFTNRTGTFLGLEELTALCRTSHQVRNELDLLVWKVNTFKFHENGMYFPRYRRHHKLESVANIQQAYTFFLKHTKSHILKLLQSVEFEIGYQYNHEDADSTNNHNLHRINNLVKVLPQAKFKVVLQYTDLREIDDDTCSSISSFVEEHRVLLRQLDDFGLPASKRSWRIFPHSRPAKRDWLLPQAQLSAEAAQLLEWVDHGF